MNCKHLWELEYQDEYREIIARCQLCLLKVYIYPPGALAPDIIDDINRRLRNEMSQS